MPRIYFLLAILLFGLTTQAQGLTFEGVTSEPVTETPTRSSGLEMVYVLASTPGVTASWEGPARWSRFSRMGAAYAEAMTSTMVSGRSTVNLVAGEDQGYVVEDAQGRSHYFWVADYSLHTASFEALEPSEQSDCSMTVLSFTGHASAINYYSINGAPIQLSRQLRLSYNSLQYDEGLEEYVNLNVEKTIADINTEVFADAPLCNTTFTLSGDRFLEAWGRGISVTSPLCEALAVEASTSATQQGADERPENEMKTDYTLGGSAPCDIVFKAAVTDAAIFREWQMSDDQTFENIDMRDNSLEWSYTFRDQGTWYVRFVCANAAGSCDYISETYTVGIADSYLKCPNAFSPQNQDGVNDEWRVSYRSLLDYECHIFNRWGQELFSSKDPAQGWDGRKGNKFVPSGVYFYVVQATGSDGKKYKLKGDINIIGYDPNAKTSPDNPQFE